MNFFYKNNPSSRFTLCTHISIPQEKNKVFSLTRQKRFQTNTILRYPCAETNKHLPCTGTPRWTFFQAADFGTINPFLWIPISARSIAGRRSWTQFIADDSSETNIWKRCIEIDDFRTSLGKKDPDAECFLCKPTLKARANHFHQQLRI